MLDVKRIGCDFLQGFNKCLLTFTGKRKPAYFAYRNG